MCSNSLFPCSCYRDAVGAAEETRIRVENIQGAVLLLSAEDDIIKAAKSRCHEWRLVLVKYSDISGFSIR